jgi:hypothetical protein
MSYYRNNIMIRLIFSLIWLCITLTDNKLKIDQFSQEAEKWSIPIILSKHTSLLCSSNAVYVNFVGLVPSPTSARVRERKIMHVNKQQRRTSVFNVCTVVQGNQINTRLCECAALVLLHLLFYKTWSLAAFYFLSDGCATALCYKLQQHTREREM